MMAPDAVAQPAQGAVQVGVVAVTRQAVAEAVGFTGRIEAINKVEIKARVTGFVDEVLFTDGALLAAGAPLYRIEQAPFAAAVQQAQGALLQAQGAYANASLQRQRADDLVKTQAASVATRDQRVADEQNAQGAVVRADADLKTAQINMGYTEITSPIAGRVGRSAVTKGNVVTPTMGALTTVLSQDPIYVTFPVSQREFLKVQQTETALKVDSLLVKLRFADGSIYGQDGKIDFIDNTVDRSTDTITVRAVVANPKGNLVDGQFVSVTVQGDTPAQRLVVPQSALISDQQGAYVFVAKDGKAEVRRLKLGAEAGVNVVVEDGLAEGDLVITEGIQMLRPGAPIVPSPAHTVKG